MIFRQRAKSATKLRFRRSVSKYSSKSQQKNHKIKRNELIMKKSKLKIKKYFKLEKK